MHSAHYWVEKLGLEAHPEGGYFKETYRSAECFVSANNDVRFPVGRNYSTSIYFLLTQDNFSAFHKIKSDEIWHFYEGHTIEIFYFDKQLNRILLGNDPDKGEVFQAVVPAGFIKTLLMGWWAVPYRPVLNFRILRWQPEKIFCKNFRSSPSLFTPLPVHKFLFLIACLCINFAKNN